MRAVENTTRLKTPLTSRPLRFSIFGRPIGYGLVAVVVLCGVSAFILRSNHQNPLSALVHKLAQPKSTPPDSAIFSDLLSSCQVKVLKDKGDDLMPGIQDLESGTWSGERHIAIADKNGESLVIDMIISFKGSDGGLSSSDAKINLTYELYVMGDNFTPTPIPDNAELPSLPVPLANMNKYVHYAENTGSPDINGFYVEGFVTENLEILKTFVQWSENVNNDPSITTLERRLDKENNYLFRCNKSQQEYQLFHTEGTHDDGQDEYRKSVTTYQRAHLWLYMCEHSDEIKLAADSLFQEVLKQAQIAASAGNLERQKVDAIEKAKQNHLDSTLPQYP